MWLKKIKKRKVQMLLIGIIALLSSFMLAASIGIIINVSEPMDKLIKDTKAPALYFTINKTEDTDKIVEDVKNGFLKDSKVTGVKVMNNVIYSVSKVKGNGKYFDLSCEYILQYKAGEFGTPKFLQGGGALKYGECYIGSGLAQAYKISFNDSIVIEDPNGNTRLKVKGIYAEPYNVTISLGGTRIYVNDKQLEKISGVKREMIAVYSAPDTPIKDIVSNYKKNNNKQIMNNILSLDLAKMAAEIGAQILGGIIACFALIILVVSAIVIRASIYDSIIKEYKTIGVYKALGYSSRTIIDIYLKAYSSVIAAAAFIGAFLSSFLTKRILENSFKAYGTDIDVNYEIPIIVTVVIVVLIMLASIFGVIRRTKKIPPVEALTLGNPVNSSKGTNLDFIQNKFSPVFQAFRKILCYKKFTMILLLVLLMCSYIVAFSVNFYNNISALKNDSIFWFGFDNAHYKVTISGTEKANDILKWIESNKTVKNYAYGDIGYSPAVVDKNDLKTGDGGLLINAYNEFDNDIKEKVLEGRNPKYDNEIALSKKLQMTTGKSIGDYIDIYINGNKKSLLITGTFQSMMKAGMTARVKESVIMSADKNHTPEAIYFNLNNDKNYEAFKSEIKKQFGNSIDVFESKDYYKDMLNDNIEPAIDGMVPFVGLAIIVGAINVLSIIMLMNLNSRKQFCIYKSLGYSTADLIITNMCYILILGIAAVLLCIPLFCLSYSQIVNTIFSNFGIYKLNTEIKPVLLFISLSISIGIYILSTLISSFSIRKFEVNELNEE